MAVTVTIASASLVVAVATVRSSVALRFGAVA